MAAITPFTPAAAAKNTSLDIDSSLTIVESDKEPAALRRATQDLRDDFKRVFDQSPRVATRLEDAGPVSLLIAQSSSVPPEVNCAKTSDTEAFAFSRVQRGSGRHKQNVVCLIGADMRGTIYAVYEFSQRVLGIDPMYLWTDKEPAKRNSIPLPENFTHTYPSPVFHYRGFFINDEDLLTGWAPPDNGEQTGISLKVWDQIFETILRLKGNMVVPGTWIFPDDSQVRAAGERGLIVNQHHATPLGLNVARWPKDVPYNFSTHPEILEKAWSNAVAQYSPTAEILWTVGLRGLSDQSYAVLDPSVRNNDPLLGQRISEAIAEQMTIVRQRYPNAHFISNLWQEGDRLMQEGYLKIPPEVTLVWADTGYGDMQDRGKVSKGQGAYIHVAMMNFHANQLSEMVSVKTLQSELGRYIEAGATEFVLMNTSDIRPVAMTARAVMEIAWGGVSKQAGDAGYYRQWATEEFGAKAAPAMEKLYAEYFSAPSLWRSPSAEARSDVAPRLLGDQHYHTEARLFILEELTHHQVAEISGQAPKWMPPRLLTSFTPETLKAMRDMDIESCASALPRWDAVWNDALAAETSIDPERRNYYQAEVLTPITINREGNRMLLYIAQAIEDAHAGKTEKAKGETADALASLDTVLHAMSAAEYGKWKNWYRGDWLTGVRRTRELVQAFADHLNDPMAPLPAPLEWTHWEAYFHIMEYEGDRSVDVH